MTAYANKEFWTAYREYVDESLPRHTAAVATLLPAFFESRRHVLDLGCGRVKEGHRLAWTHNYLGVDLDPDPVAVKAGHVLQGDYRDLDALVALTRSSECSWRFEPDTIISLFSIEPTADHESNEAFYTALFALFPRAREILSAGFFYGDKAGQMTVQETGGLVSYQTIGPLARPPLRETRLVERGPSRLFGPDVVEVWRLLRR